MSYSGTTVTGRWVDEAANIKPHQFPTALPGSFKPVVKPISVPCRYCHADPGETCQKWKRGRRGKFLVDRDPHPDRKHDARIATEAVRALNLA